MSQQRLVAGVIAIVYSLFSVLPLQAWSEGGHHLIAAIAFDLLTPTEQESLISILAEHPRYREDFKIPEKLVDQRESNRWLIGRASYWPDVARRQKNYNRPKWHYELGATLTLGDLATNSVPERPGQLIRGATLETEELHIAQALELCQSIMADDTQRTSDRAIALCWIGHLVADSHQPCHAGSLYMEKVFPTKDGDRGANSIPTKQRGNMHALWDGLLGADWSLDGNRRRSQEIINNKELTVTGEQAALSLNPQVWLEESRSEAIANVYTPEVMDSLAKVQRGLLQQPEEINLSESYLKNAGGIAQRRATQAAYRLAATWKACLVD